MEIKVRRGIFETNSSSVHAISIYKGDEELRLPNKVIITTGEFGWETNSYADYNTKISYIYQICKAADLDYEYERRYGDEDQNEARAWRVGPDQRQRFVKILERAGIKVIVDDKDYTDDWPYDLQDATGYIDHSNNWFDGLDELLSNEDRLLRFLFLNESVLYTGNDNDNNSIDFLDSYTLNQGDDYEVLYKHN